MNPIIVNKIIVDNNAIHGVVITESLVLDNLRTIFGDDTMMAVVTHFNNQKDGAHSIFRHGQFVVYLERRPTTGYSMKFSDFKNNIDNALDEYLELESKGWLQEDRAAYVQIVNDIISSPSEIVQMKSFG